MTVVNIVTRGAGYDDETRIKALMTDAELESLNVGRVKSPTPGNWRPVLTFNSDRVMSELLNGLEGAGLGADALPMIAFSGKGR